MDNKNLSKILFVEYTFIIETIKNLKKIPVPLYATKLKIIKIFYDYYLESAHNSI